jgi:hypothetical protein
LLLGRISERIRPARLSRDRNESGWYDGDLMKQLLFLMWPLLALFTASPGEAASRVVPRERVTRNVVVRAAPSTHSSPVDVLAPGEAAILLDEVSGWYRVQLPDGRTGYVSKSWAVLVDEDEAATWAQRLCQSPRQSSPSNTG